MEAGNQIGATQLSPWWDLVRNTSVSLPQQTQAEVAPIWGEGGTEEYPTQSEGDVWC